MKLQISNISKTYSNGVLVGWLRAPARVVVASSKRLAKGASIYYLPISR